MSDGDFTAGMARLEELLARAERACSPESLPVVRELVRALLDVHRVGLGELLRAIEEATPGGLRSAASREAVAGLLLMHDLHPDVLATRVERALAEANDAAPGAAIAELTRLDGTEIRVRVSGRAAAAEVLAKLVERTLCEHAPDAVLHLDVQSEGERPPSGFVPLERLRARPGGAA